MAFFQDVFGIEAWGAPEGCPGSDQRSVLQDVARYSRVSVRSGQKTGKSLSCGGLAWWWATTRPGGRVILTAPVYTQVKKVLWREVKRLGRLARESGLIEVPDIPKDPSTGIEFADGSEIFGLTTSDTENLGGFSGAHMLFIIDEASGYKDEFFHALLGNMGGGEEDDPNAEAKIVKFGNPTKTSGHFYEDFRNMRESIRCHRISSEDTPNAVAGKALVPGLATKGHVQRILEECGGNPLHPLYQVRVAGNPPPQGTRAVIPLTLVDDASARWGEVEPTGRLQLGVDVARYGDDDTVCVARRGLSLVHESDDRGPLHIRSENGLDEPAAAGMVLAQVKALRRPSDTELPLVKVDAIGIGAAVASLLREAKDDRGLPLVEVVEVRSNEPGHDPDKYPNIRSELWFETANWLREGGAIPPDSEVAEATPATTMHARRLHAQLVAPEFTFDGQGRQVVEKKAEFKKRLGRSPDHADALALSIYHPPLPTAPAVYEPPGGGGGSRYGGMGRGYG